MSPVKYRRVSSRISESIVSVQLGIPCTVEEGSIGTTDVKWYRGDILVSKELAQELEAAYTYHIVNASSAASFPIKDTVKGLPVNSKLWPVVSDFRL